MIDVSCALITGQNGKVLVTQRSSSMRLPLKWEFPGGKVEMAETAEECLHREIYEELGIKIEIIRSLTPAVFDDGKAAIRLIPFECIITKGDIVLAEHASFMWLDPAELEALDWAPADIPVLKDFLDKL